MWMQDRTDLGADIVHGITYGIGTDGHHGLIAKISSDPDMPTDARITATWLMKAA